MLKLFMKNKKGFTLVELMVVVVILGILVAIAVPVYNNVSANAQQRACHANLRTIDGAKSAWQMAVPTRANQAPGNDADFLAMFNDGAIPTCPTGGAYTIPGNAQSTCATHNGY